LWSFTIEDKDETGLVYKKLIKEVGGSVDVNKDVAIVAALNKHY
jgi:hypothetical protein